MRTKRTESEPGMDLPRPPLSDLTASPYAIRHPVIGAWLRKCKTESSHQLFCDMIPRHGSHQASVQQAALHLIDVKTNSVVPAPKGAIYVAILYVWGSG